MKGILVTLALLQLALLCEGARIRSAQTCSQNKELKAWKKALLHKLKQHRGKRQTSLSETDWCHCETIGFLELNDGSFFHHWPTECCNSCTYGFIRCRRRYNLYLCASRRHQCTCDCREKQLKIVNGFKKSERTSKNICVKTRCNDFKKCCVEDQCVKLPDVRKAYFSLPYKAT